MASVRASLFFNFADRYGNLVINIVSTVALARLLTPVETGLYSIAAGLINIAQSFREFGVSTYILQERDLTREKIASALGVCLLIAGMLAAIFAVAADDIAALYGNGRLTPIIQVLSLNFILVAFASVGGAQMRRNMMFRVGMLISWTSTAANAIASLALAAMNFGAISLAYGSLVGVAVSLIGNYLVLRDQALTWPSLRRWRDLVHFGVFSTANGLLTGLADRTPDLVIGRLVSLEGVGLFSRGNGLVTLFRQAVTGVIDPVISSSMAEIYRHGGDPRDPLLRIFSHLSAVGWPALVLLGILARPIILILFGSQWGGSIGVAQILCAGTALALIGNVCTTYLASTGAVRSNFVIQIVSVPTLVAGVAIGSVHSLEAAASGAAFAGGLMTLLSLEILRRRIDLAWGAIIRAVLPSLAMVLVTALPPAAVITLLGPLSDDRIWTIGFVAGVSGVLAWGGSIYLVRHPLRHEMTLLRSWARRKLAR